MISTYLKLLTCIIAICFFNQVAAQDLPKELYTASTIPDSLKENANAVVRYSRENMEISGPGKALDKTHTVITILNEKGKDEAEMDLPYNRKFNSVSAVEMKIYSADGLLLKKYHKSDMYDHAAIDNETMVTDERKLYLEHTISSYPLTVEITVEEDIRSSVDLGSWYIQSPEEAVQNAGYQLSIKSDAGFRYLNKNTTVKPQKSTANGIDTYTWHVTNLKSFKIEDGAMAWRVIPRNYFAANDFVFYGVTGSINSWQTYSKWLHSLHTDVNTLSPQRAEEVRKMTADIKTDKEKAKFLYSYLQQNMRYVSIQLGIGGFKPFAATFVDEKKYGDCKALANYMCALLKAVNIPSYCAVITAGSNEEAANPLFPYHSFNHEILCIPFNKDTTWLDCTMSTRQFGKLGPFTENRNALLLTEDGGKLVNTPKSLAEDNQFNSVVHVVLDADGGAKAMVKILSTGEYREEYIGLAAEKVDLQKEYLLKDLNMKQPSAFTVKPADDKDGIKELDLDLDYDHFCDVSAGDKKFYRPAVFSLWKSTIPVLEKRKSDFYFEFPMLKTCVTTIDLPAGFEAESVPANVSLKFTYGKYDIVYAYDPAKNQLTSTAKFALTTQVIPADKYNEMQLYMDNVAKAQNKKLVIKRKAA